jgi:hypothetical protein
VRQAWIRLTVAYWRDPKFNGLGPMHEAFYVRLLGYTVEHHTDGLIHANAIALCGRGMRNRKKLLADLVNAGLLVEKEDASIPLAFPAVWHQYQSSAHAVSHQRTSSEHQTAGQAARSRAGAKEERRGEMYLEELEDSLAQAMEAPEDMQGVLGRIHQMKWGKTNGSA